MFIHYCPNLSGHDDRLLVFVSSFYTVVAYDSHLPWDHGLRFPHLILLPTSR